MMRFTQRVNPTSRVAFRVNGEIPTRHKVSHAFNRTDDAYDALHRESISARYDKARKSWSTWR